MAKNSKSSKNYTTPILVSLLVVAAFVIGMLWQQLQNSQQTAGTTGTNTQEIGNQQPQQPVVPTAGPVKPVDDGDHIRGDENAEVTLIVYSDYECPFCQKVHPDLLALLDEFEGQVRMVFRHFPLEQIHTKAKGLAIASECVAKLAGEDAFWEYTDSVFEQGGNIADAEEIASDLGISSGEFQTCIEDPEMANLVMEDAQSGLEVGIQGTPGSILVNRDGVQKSVEGAQPYENFKSAVESLL